MNGLTEHHLRKFWAKVKILGPDDCWEWQGRRILSNGGKKYGAAYLPETRGTCTAHRLAYMEANQICHTEIKGMIVRHTCDNPPCCNPNHLEVGTPQDNSNDMVRRGRSCSTTARYVLTPNEVLEICDLLRFTRITQAKIAEIYNTVEADITRINIGGNWKHITGHFFTKGVKVLRAIHSVKLRGESHGSSKLTEDNVRDMRERYASQKVTMRVLGYEYGISAPTVLAVIRRKTWKHIL